MDIAVHPPPLADGIFDGGEVVVQKNHVRRVLGDVGTRDAHGDADVRFFQRGGIVDSVARHGGDFARALQRLNDAQLIRGRHARKHDARFHRFVQLFVRHFVQFLPGDDGIPIAENVQLFGDRHRGDFVVARNHDDADTRRVAGFHRLNDFLAGRVDHADDADKGQIAFEVAAFVLGHFGNGTNRKTEHAQRLRAHLVADFEDLLAVGFRHFAHAVLCAVLRTQRQHFVHRALGINGEFPFHAVEYAHALTVGIEGLLECARVRVLIFFAVDAEFFGEVHERALRGVAQDVAGIVGILFRIDAQRRARKEILIHGTVVFFRYVLNFCGYALQKVVADGEVRDRHFIEGERTRFIAADDGGAAQRFHGGQAFDERVFLCHALHA